MMKIGIMGAWNTDSGAAIHSELIGRSFIELGHEVVVFTFFRESIHGTAIVGEDEDYVIRCFTLSSAKNPELLATPFLCHEYEFFIVEDLGMLPQDHLGKIFHWIKRRAKTVTVIHDGNLKEDPSFYQFDWDAIVCFDERYYNFLKLAYPEEIIHIIPFPCLPWRGGEGAEDKRRIKIECREKLGLPLDRRIIFLFGPTSKFGADKFDILKELHKDYPLLILVVTRHPEALERWRRLKKANADIEIIQLREENPDIGRLYEYLYASDLLFYNKPTKPNTVTVSSTAFQCLGSGCPMVARDSPFVETLRGIIYQFRTDEELRSSIESVFNEDRRYKEIMKNTRAYVNEHSGLNIARKFIQLFEILNEEGR